MRWLREWRRRWRALFNRAEWERNLDEELRDYLEREIEREAMAGAAPEEARRRALASLQGAERLKEECRDARGVRWLEDTLSDVRFAFRSLCRSPLFAVTTIAALAFCIGLNAAIFSVVDTVLFRPLPFPEQDRLVSVTEGVPALGFPVMPFSAPDYLFVSANNHSFEATGVYRTAEYEISGAGQPRRINGARFSASMFQVLGVAPAIGRVFTPNEDDHAARVAVLNEGFARSLFGTPQQALGRTILLYRIPYQVIGVMPRCFSFPIRGSRFNDEPAELFVPVSFDNENRKQRVNDFDYSMIARLRPDVTVQQADAEVKGLIRRIVENYPPSIKQMLQHLPKFSLEAHAIPFREEFTGNVQRALLLLLGAVGVVLLIGCADVANLMFSRMVGRRREFAVRTALGAGFWRLTRQTLTEGLLLSTVGGMIGFGLAYLTLPSLIHFAPDTLPRLNEIGLNWRITAFVAAVTLATPVLFCLAPLVSTMRSAAVSQLHGESRTMTQGKRERLIMSGAVIVQFSLAFLLLTTAGLLARSFVKASETNPGFEREHVLSMRITLPYPSYKTQTQIKGLFDRLLARVGALPGVRQAGAISDLPMSSSSNVILTAEGAGRQTERADTLFCLGDALKTLGVRLKKGRLLEPRDYVGKQHVTVITEGLAKRFWPKGNPIGRHVKFGVDDPMNDEPWLTVIGVVADVKTKLTSNSPRMALFTTPADWVNTMNVVVRTAVDPLSLANAIRQQLRQLDPNLPAGRIETVGDVLNESLSAERFRTWLLSCFAVAAMLLATLGIGGLLAYSASQRMQEFGVRVALGANRRNLLSLVLRNCLRLSGTGIAAGLLVSFASTRTLSALLYDTSPFDAATFITVASILLLVATGAAMIPAWRVIHVDPIESLRAE